MLENDLFAPVNEKRGGRRGQPAKQIFLRRELHRRIRSGYDVAIIRRQKTLPHDVGIRSAAKSGGDGRRTAGVAGRSQRDDNGQAFLRQRLHLAEAVDLY